jgi:uncharacterized protein YjbJ (UPF0337 family)
MGLDDKIKNAAQDIAGKAKEALGDHKGDESLKAEGQKDQTSASAKKVGEDVKDVFKADPPRSRARFPHRGGGPSTFRGPGRSGRSAAVGGRAGARGCR